MFWGEGTSFPQGEFLRAKTFGHDSTNVQISESSRASWLPLLYFFGLADAALSSEINAGAWSPVYCMTRRSNIHKIFSAALIANLSCGQRISFRELPIPRERIGQFSFFGQTLRTVSAKTTHGSGRPTMLRSVQREKRVHRPCTKNLLYITSVQTLQIIICL
ncbi:hypothetical protein PoB_003667700 [Plakobranchus ocellatus]|uniref:Uncharacterized protein n=1 Tax=Plakobranchus ocellatus TaxID=259542 RepID=A0AAV4ATC5_9GAST|nr:hypothetical protein PoB_003667700 [Plakobranchus ocellatus]